MKNSGISWIGDIPKDWKVCFIKQIMRNKSIKGYPDEMVLSLYRDYGVVPKNSRSDNHNVTSEDTSSYKFVEVGDFVINKMKAWQGSMAVSEFQGIISPAYYICRFTSNEVNKRYIHYLLRNDSYKTEYMRLSSGLRVGQWDLNIDDFLRIKMVLPSLEEQQKIASFLDRKCLEIDEMTTLQEKIVEELKAYKQSVITEAVTKGLNPDVPMKDSGIEWIGEIPEHWEVKPIKYIKSKEKNSFADGPFGSNLKSEHFVENGDVLVIESGFITTGKFIYKDFKTITKEHFETIKRSECKAKDIIIAKIGANYGMSGELPVLDKPSVVSGNSLKITLDNQKYLNPIFVYAMMTAKSNKGFLDLVQENAQPALSLSGLNNFRLPSAPIEEQQAIADYLDEKCADIDSLIQTKQSKIDSLKEYKKSIIYEYVTGKKEVE